MKVHVIGAGIVGLFSAYYLNEAGFDVTILDQTDGEDGCSYGNAGMIVPSHFIPLAAPGMVEKGIKWMFHATSPFYVKPRLDWSMMQWGFRFLRSANTKHVERAMPVLRDLGLLSKSLYKQLDSFDFGFAEKGLLMLCKEEQGFEEEVETAHKAQELGLDAQILNREEIHKMEPETKPEVMGGVFFSGDTHCVPNDLVKNLKAYLKIKGVQFSFDTVVVKAETGQGKIVSLGVMKAGIPQKLNTDQIVMAAGSWSEPLSKIFGLTIPVQAGKGYSFNRVQVEGKKIVHPSILLEARVAVTPFHNDQIRFGGTMELGGINHKINKNRVKGIVQAARDFYTNYELAIPDESTVWSGLRPCSPDGMPYIGKSKKYENLIVATGHAMMGLSLAPATGKLVTEICSSVPLSVSSELLNPERFNK